MSDPLPVPLLVNMALSPSVPSLGTNLRPTWIAQEASLPLEVASQASLRYLCRFKRSLKLSVLHVEACLLDKVFGPSRVHLPRFERELKVFLRMGEPDSEGKVETFIIGRHRYRKRAKRLIRVLAVKSQRKRGSAVMLDLERMKSLKRENVHSSDFISTTVRSSLDEAMESLQIGVSETGREPATKTPV